MDTQDSGFDGTPALPSAVASDKPALLSQQATAQEATFQPHQVPDKVEEHHAAVPKPEDQSSPAAMRNSDASEVKNDEVLVMDSEDLSMADATQAPVEQNDAVEEQISEQGGSEERNHSALQTTGQILPSVAGNFDASDVQNSEIMAQDVDDALMADQPPAPAADTSAIEKQIPEQANTAEALAAAPPDDLYKESLTEVGDISAPAKRRTGSKKKGGTRTTKGKSIHAENDWARNAEDDPYPSPAHRITGPENRARLYQSSRLAHVFVTLQRAGRQEQAQEIDGYARRLFKAEVWTERVELYQRYDSTARSMGDAQGFVDEVASDLDIAGLENEAEELRSISRRAFA